MSCGPTARVAIAPAASPTLGHRRVLSTRPPTRSTRASSAPRDAFPAPAAEPEAIALREHLRDSVDLWSTSGRWRLPGGGAEHGVPPRFTLSYMAMRNRAEVPRLIMEEARCPYVFEVIGFTTWREDVKPSWIPEFRGNFGKLPVLTVHDESLTLGGPPVEVGQETAITRLLARACGLAGDDPLTEARLDALYTFYFCTLRNDGVTHEGQNYAAGALRDAAASGKTLTREEAPSYRSMPRVNDFSVAERSLAALGAFEEQLERSTTGFLADQPGPSYVDMALLCELLELAEPDHVPDFAERFRLPRLGAFAEEMRQRPGIAAYLASPRRVPRYDRPGYTYKGL